jgi:hypothetical protein
MVNREKDATSSLLLIKHRKGRFPTVACGRRPSSDWGQSCDSAEGRAS